MGQEPKQALVFARQTTVTAAEIPLSTVIAAMPPDLCSTLVSKRATESITTCWGPSAWITRLWFRCWPLPVTLPDRESVRHWLST